VQEEHRKPAGAQAPQDAFDDFAELKD